MGQECVICPMPIRPSRKHSFDSNDPQIPGGKKRRRCSELSPALSVRPQPALAAEQLFRDKRLDYRSKVSVWLSSLPLPRSKSDPVLSSSTKHPGIRRPLSVSPEPAPVSLPMSQKTPRSSSATSTKVNVSGSFYRHVAFQNGVTIDVRGVEIEEEDDVKELVNNRILKRSDSALPQNQVDNFLGKAADHLNDNEEVAIKLLNTVAFPTEEPGIIAEGRDSQWNQEALPNNPKYPHCLSAPKPDRYYGFCTGPKFKTGWTDEETAVIDHPAAMPYTLPARDAYRPFLSLEFKSEATGGTIYHAENQGAGSGAHMVSSRRWLLKEAYPDRELTATDAIAFVGAISQRVGVFYVVWYSSRKERYIMSKFQHVCLLEPAGAQACKETVENIKQYALEIDLAMFRKALEKLYPVPLTWSKTGSKEPSANEGPKSNDSQKQQSPA